jgi:3-methyladenine DNA glycosylase AlkD
MNKKINDCINLIEKNLYQKADLDYAKKANAYLLNQFKLLGVYTPQRQLAIKDILKVQFSKEELVELVNVLYHKEYRDFKYVAISLIKKNIKLFNINDLVWLKSLILIEPWWETVDSFAPVVGEIVKNNQRPMNDWINDESFWIRRAAIIHQLGWKLKTNKELLSQYALKQSSEKEFFIRKAIGWAFRDYARHNPNFVNNFMNDNKGIFSNLTYKEATKHLN